MNMERRMGGIPVRKTAENAALRNADSAIREGASGAEIEKLQTELDELDAQIKPLREELRVHEDKIDEIAEKLTPLLDKRSALVQAITTKGGKSIS